MSEWNVERATRANTARSITGLEQPPQPSSALLRVLNSLYENT